MSSDVAEGRTTLIYSAISKFPTGVKISSVQTVAHVCLIGYL